MNRHPFRYICELGVGVLVALLAVETWMAMGLVVPVAVSGSSMAPTLRGPHRLFRCPDCHAGFSVGLDEAPEDPRAFCPACGSRRAALADKVTQAGDRLIVNRTAFAWRDPQRWEVVVFRSPDAVDELCVKRIVGLPGESVSLAHGDVLIDGRSVRKSLAEQQALAQLVHRAAPDHIELNSLKQPAWRITLLPAGDAMLTVQARLADDGKLRMVIDNRLGRLEASFDAVADEIRLFQDGRLLGETKVSAWEVPLGNFSQWTFSLFDAQALVAVDGYALAKALFAVGTGPENPSLPPEAPRWNVAIYGSGVTISEPAVWRDAYYEYRYGDRRADAPPPSQPAAVSWQLGPDEYFVLGDHAEISDDSRSWLAGPGLAAKLLFGKPLGVR